MLKKLIHSPRGLYQAIGLRSHCLISRICQSLNSKRALPVFLIICQGSNWTFSAAFAENKAQIKSKSTPARSSKKFVSGILYDVPFQMNDAFVSSRKLVIRTALNVCRTGLTRVRLSYRQSIELTFPQAEKLEGQTFSFKSFERQMIVDGDSQPAPTLMINVLEGSYPELVQPTDPYTLILTFYKPSHDMLPGFIDLQSDGAHKTHLRGFFYAKLTR